MKALGARKHGPDADSDSGRRVHRRPAWSRAWSGSACALTAIAVLTLSMGLREAVPLIIVPVLITNVWQMTRGGTPVPIFKRFWTMIVLLGIGAWLGTVLLFVIDETLVGALLGVVIIVYSLVNIFAVRFRIPPEHEVWYSPGDRAAVGVADRVDGFGRRPGRDLFPGARPRPRNVLCGRPSLAFFLSALPWGGALIAEGALTVTAARRSARSPCCSVLRRHVRWASYSAPGCRRKYFPRAVFGFLILIGANLIRRAIV